MSEPRKRRLPSGHREWTEEERERIKLLYAEGKTYSQIAAEMGVNKNQVSSVISRIKGLTSRGSPVVPAEEPKPELIRGKNTLEKLYAWQRERRGE